MKYNFKPFILKLLKFIALNIALYVFCFFTITPYFRSSASAKRIIEEQNQISYSHYNLNVKTLVYREDYIIDNNTKKEIHREK